MNKKFINSKKEVILVISAIILASQLVGCAVVNSNSMVEMLNSGEDIAIEVVASEYASDIEIPQDKVQKIEWVQLDKLKTHNVFRQNMDTLFNITIVSENEQDGKNGCLFVGEDNLRNGNSTLLSAFTNKEFMERYYTDSNKMQELIKLAKAEYTDIEDNDELALTAAFNSYYNLFEDGKDPSVYNANQSISREDFYTMIFKATNAVKEVEESAEFDTQVGGKTEKTKYAKEIQDKAWLNTTKGCLDAENYQGKITRAEAVYMAVNAILGEDADKAQTKKFADCKNAGDLALRLKFKEKNDKKEIVEKQNWQAFVLAYMVKNPDNGMQEELYKTMEIANGEDLLTGNESRWEQAITKHEAVQLVMNTMAAKDRIAGHLTTAEYGTIDANEMKIVDGKEVPGYITMLEDPETGETIAQVSYREALQYLHLDEKIQRATGEKKTLADIQQMFDDLRTGMSDKEAYESLVEFSNKLTVKEEKPAVVEQKPVQGQTGTDTKGQTGNGGGQAGGNFGGISDAERLATDPAYCAGSIDPNGDIGETGELQAH